MCRQRSIRFAVATLTTMVLMGVALLWEPSQAFAGTTSTLTFGGGGPKGVAYDAANGDVYVANTLSNTVSVIDGSTNRVISTIKVGSFPNGVAYDAGNGDVYVANSSGSGTVSVIDGNMNKVTNTITVGSFPDGVAYDAGNGDVYVTNQGSDKVSVIGGSMNKVTSTITVGSNPGGVTYDAASGDMYVADGSDKVSVIGGSMNKVTNTITVGSAPYGMAYDAGNEDVYVADSSSNAVSVIDGRMNKVTSTIPVGNGPTGVAYDAGNGEVYVTDSSSNAVSIVLPAVVPTITSSSVGPGSVVDSMAITATPNMTGDTFAVQVTSTPTSAVAPGAPVPSGATIYTSGNNISNVAVGDVVTLYEVNSGSVIAATSFTLTKSDILGATITYDGNGASGTVPMDSNQYMVGASATVADQGNLTRTGYTFEGWNTKAGGSGTSYKSGSTLTIGTSNVTLYAQWTADATAVPSGLAHSNVTQTGWTETWAPVSNAFSYDVYLNGNQVGSTAQSVYSYGFSNEIPGTTYKVQVSSVNAVSQVSTKSASDSVTTAVYGGGGPVAPTIIQDSFTEPAQVGQKYSAVVHEIGGTSPMNWSIASGSLPTGLSLDSQGVISGTPTLAGKYTFTVKVMDANSLSSTKQLTLTVNGLTSTGGGTGSSTSPTTSVVVTTSKEHSAFFGHFVKVQLQANDGQTPYTWAIAGTLPRGLQLNSTTGVLSGTPDKPGVHQVTVRVTGAAGTRSEKTMTLDVLRNYEREVLWNGNVKNVPAIVQKEGTIATTYMPIWYVMQLLKPMGVQSTWDGKRWHMTTPTKADLSNVQAGKGNTSIYLNGALVQMVNTVAQNDPSTNKPTTYMPIWYVMQLLKRVGLQSKWNGTTWTVTK